MTRSTRHAGRAVVHLLVLLGVLWGAGYALTHSPATFQLYRTWRFPQSQGHHLAGKLAEAQTARGDLCLLIGPSTVREAFDEAVMDDAAPSLRFVNGGTSGGSIFGYEAMLELVRQSRVEPECLVIGLNAWMLVSRETRLDAAGYADFLDEWNAARFVQHEDPDLRAAAQRQAQSNSRWPYRRPARHLGRLLRSGLFVAQAHLSWHEPQPLDAFALWPRELGRSAPYQYDDTAPLDDAACAQIVARYEAEGLFRPERYAQPEHVAALERVLDHALTLAPTVVVMRMPQSSFGREVLEPLADTALERTLERYAERGVITLDRTTDLPDDAFRDVAHLLSRARGPFSERAARDIADVLARKETAP